MKIRIKGNFIRYRLTQPEVKAISEGKRLEEQTCFGPAAHQTFAYALETAEGIEGLRASFDGQIITLFIPASAAATWYEEERVGFENEQEVAPGVRLKMLLEKDFACMDTSHEDQSDKFPNPKLIC